MLLLRSPVFPPPQSHPCRMQSPQGPPPPPCSPGSPVVSGGLGWGGVCPSLPSGRGCRLRTQNPLGLLRRFLAVPVPGGSLLWSFWGQHVKFLRRGPVVVTETFLFSRPRGGPPSPGALASEDGQLRGSGARGLARSRGRSGGRAAGSRVPPHPAGGCVPPGEHCGRPGSRSHQAGRVAACLLSPQGRGPVLPEVPPPPSQGAGALSP